MSNEVTLSGAAGRAFASIRQQLANTMALLSNQEEYLSDLIAQSEELALDDYNNAVSINDQLNAQLDQKQSLIDALNVEIHSLKESMNSMEGRTLEAERQLAKLEKLRAAELAVHRDTARQLKALNDFNPMRMKEKLREKTTLLDEQRRRIRELTDKALLASRAEVAAQKENALLMQQINAHREELERMARRSWIEECHAKWLKRPFTNPEDSESEYFCYVMPGDLYSKAGEILKLEWKMFVMASNGEGCVIMMTEWLCPVLPPSALARRIPKAMVDAIMHFTIEVMTETHKPLVDRMMWSQDISMRDVVTDKHADLLAANNVLTLHDIMLHGGFKLAQLKGIGEKTADAIMNSANAYVSANWSAPQEQAA